MEAGLGYIYQGLSYTNNRLTGWTKGSSTIQPTTAVTGEATTSFMGASTSTAQYDALGRRRTEVTSSNAIQP